MPRPGLRSHAQARKKVRTPGNRNIIHYTRRKPKRAHCAICKKPLQSIPRLRTVDMKKQLKPREEQIGWKAGGIAQNAFKI